MTDALKNIITGIDKWYATKLTGKFYGIAELINKQAERFPVTIATQRDRINPADTWQLQTYHRILNSTQLPTQEEFGKNLAYQITVRMVIITNVNMGEDFIYRMLNLLPTQVRINGAYAVVEDGAQVNNDHESIAATEFGQMFEDKHRLTKNIWSVDYNLSLTYCIDDIVKPDPTPPPGDITMGSTTVFWGNTSITFND